MKIDLSPESWGRVIVSTVLGTAICIGAALYADSFNFAHMNGALRTSELAIDVLLPILLAVPMLLFLTGKLRELAIAHRKLLAYASTDSLTQLLNRAAFTKLVDGFLADVTQHEPHLRGALLIIDADDFKAINDRHGHDRGDEALIAIAQSIKAALRDTDVVGRLGGEEFGVFLAEISPEQAVSIAERVRQSVSDIAFAPAGASHPLSVSVGGAVFEAPLPFAELFRLADQQLYLAKQHGRNRVAINRPPPGGRALAAA